MSQGPGGEHSVFDEPAITGKRAVLGDREIADQTVWDEPAIRAAGAEPPAGATTYASWYARMRRETSDSRRWAVLALSVVLGGPLAVVGAFFSWDHQTLSGTLSVVVFGPAVEEWLKVGLAVFLVERRPYLIPGARPLLVAACGSALAFATIENLLYLQVYLPDPTIEVAAWRWSVCTAMHVGATAISGLGLARMWQQAHDKLEPVRFATLYPYIVTAVVLHGAFNALAIVEGPVFN